MTVDRGQTWPVQYGAHEKLILRQQAKHARRALPLRWYWRLLSDEDVPGGSAQDPVFGEAVWQQRRYAEPIPVHIFIDPTGRQKGLKRGRVDTEGNGSFGWSRAEARRLGAILNTQDDNALGLQTDFPDEPLFLPRPGDIVAYSRKLWEILQHTHQDLGPTDIVVVWAGTCALVADDIVDPIEFGDTLPAPPTPVPEDTRTPASLG